MRLWVFVALLASGGASTPLASGPSVSGLWPRQTVAYSSGETALELAADFAFRPTTSSARVQRACERYLAIIFGQKELWAHATAPAGAIPLRALVVAAPDDEDAAPRLGDDESFALRVNASGAALEARSFSGVQRGLEAFAQLTIAVGGRVVINSTATVVEGAPAFAYRGLMVDTARHFVPVAELEAALDGMAASGLNVFHWHLTDAQAFPWNASAEPALIAGAYRADLTYSRADLVGLVRFAADRAIRVVPEIDMPGHAASWAAGRPDVVVDCAPDDGAPLYDGSYQSDSQLDPTSNATYELIDALVAELAEIFPDEYLHLGGDEVAIGCYNSSAEVRAWMTAHGLDTSCAPAAARGELGNNPCADGGAGYKQLVAGFIRRAQAILRARGRTPSHWQEVFDHYGGNDSATPTPPIDGLDPSAVIYDWLAPGWGWANPGNITRAGWRVVSTLGMYLSSNADATDWPAYYNLHPLYVDKNGTGAYNVSDPAEVARVLGGEGCMWGETANGDNLNLRLWPNAAALAESLWSGEGGNETEALPRLLRHRCRMRQRGVPVTPLQPGFC